jgi:squalene-hopene/tetraprenyl-beta-curcumene cyclase
LGLCHLEDRPGPWADAAESWIRGLQNRDGGWPTFCRGFGKLPFDRSGTDLTAHNLRALRRLHESRHPNGVSESEDDAIKAGFEYLRRTQRPDGSWLPLWFGNQHAPDDENPTYGTARVLAAFRDFAMLESEPARDGLRWLVDAQNSDGGWGGAPETPSSVEETALAVEILLARVGEPQFRDAVESGLTWLIEQVEAGRLADPAPIGFYFAKLWYFEKLYPIIFMTAALGRAVRTLPPPALAFVDPAYPAFAS